MNELQRFLLIVENAIDHMNELWLNVNDPDNWIESQKALDDLREAFSTITQRYQPFDTGKEYFLALKKDPNQDV